MNKFYSTNITLKTLAVFSWFAFVFLQNANAQTIKVIPNPDAGNKVGSSYIVYNNQLYTGYTDANYRVHLARWNGSGLTVLPNPDNGVGFQDLPIVFNNKLYFRYLNQAGNYQLAQYNGSSITLIANPDAGKGFDAFESVLPAPIIYNGKLYIQYATPTAYKLAEFNDINLQIVPSQDSLQSYVGAPIIYNNKFYTVWYTLKGNDQLVEYNGSTFQIIPNPDQDGDFVATSYDGSINNYPHPIIYNNKLYLTYEIGDRDNVFQLAQYDGQNVTLIPNPDDGGSIFYNDPIIYNNQLYVNYNDTTLDQAGDVDFISYLGQYNGENLDLIKNPDSSYLYFPTTKFIDYNSQLFFNEIIYGRGGNQLYLTSFNGMKDSLIPHSGTGNTDESMPVIYHGKLDFEFGYNLAQYDGQNISLIGNLNDGAYKQYPFVFNDTLFFVYQSGSVFHLAYLEDGTLAVNYLKFSAQLQNSNVILNWQTASEISTSHYNIQRSTDGIHFTIINRSIAAGNSNTIKQYTYTDNNVTALKVNKLYYRLQEVDKDGKSNYSNIETINLENENKMFVYPVPANNILHISLAQPLSQTASIVLYNINGKVALQQKAMINSTNQQLNVSALAEGNYNVVIIDNGKKTSNSQIVIMR